MNTVIDYHYAAASAKAYPEQALDGKQAIVAGELSESDLDEIRSICESREFFIAGQVGLPELQEVIFAQFGRAGDDHVFHYLDGIELTAKPATLPLSAAQLLANFRAVGDPNRWDVLGAMTRLDLG